MTPPNNQDELEEWLQKHEVELPKLIQPERMYVKMLKIIRRQYDTLKFYAESEWNDDYPGGITFHGKNNISYLDMGDNAKSAIKHINQIIRGKG